MAYTPTTWIDEVLSGAERFDIKDNVGNAIYENVQISLKTVVTTQGTSIDAAHLNNIEAGIVAASTGAALSVKGVAGNTAGDVTDIAAASDGLALVRDGTTLKFGQVKNSGLVDHAEVVYLKVFWHDETVSAGDGAAYFTVPAYLNGGSIVDFDIAVIGASSSGLVTVQLCNLGNNPLNAGTDVLSTRATIDVGEFNSMNATTQPVIANPILATGDILRVDVDVAGTGTKGLDVFFKVDKA